MSVVDTFPAAVHPARQWLASPETGRRAIGYCVALVLHGLALIALITLPPVIMGNAERAGQALDIRFYTVAGGADAETDAPLFEPPLAGGEVGTGPIGTDGDGGTGETGGTSPDLDVTDDGQADTVEPDPIAVPDPVESTVPQVEPLPEPEAATSTDPADAVIVQADGSRAPSSERSQGRPVAPPPTTPLDLNRPVATAQPGPAVPEEARPAAPISFADILARAEMRLTPEDFQILANFDGGVTGTVRDNFCLSSSDANQEAFDCPEGSQLAAPSLVRFGLMGLGEEPPEFLEDMDRLAFQLSRTGAGDTAIGRILTSVREARRDAINTPALSRQMARDQGNIGDNLGVSNPYGEEGP